MSTDGPPVVRLRSGKTTTLRLIAGFERPDSGALELDGVDVTDRPPYLRDRLAVMANGRIEQIGTPAEVYERPASESVAGFVGTSNLIDHNGRRRTLRPEKVHIVDAGQVPPGMDSASGEITEVAYVGAITTSTWSRTGRTSSPSSSHRRTTP